MPARESASTSARAMMVMVKTRGRDQAMRWKYAARRSSSSPQRPAAAKQGYCGVLMGDGNGSWSTGNAIYLFFFFISYSIQYALV